MKNKLTQIRDSYLKEVGKKLSIEQKGKINLIINNLISIPNLLENRIKEGYSKDKEKDLNRIELIYNIMYEIKINQYFVQQILDKEGQLKKGETFKNKMIEYIYKNKFA